MIRRIDELERENRELRRQLAARTVPKTAAKAPPPRGASQRHVLVKLMAPDRSLSFRKALPLEEKHGRVLDERTGRYLTAGEVLSSGLTSLGLARLLMSIQDSGPCPRCGHSRPRWRVRLVGEKFGRKLCSTCVLKVYGLQRGHLMAEIDS